ncbi:hypothetical protein BV898_04036 [Hypsibius exemplaris]|uniref:Double-strand-break repair protein rad21-like protein n=1 Tax=Hypsibius exemplaris TaxID=2072580 RepID=A0A1W0X3Q6_HYPEX|nr:hypothetical protein BV898_04036 [Hypsibius exemplaris]
MFYSTQLLSKKGPLGTAWIAGHSMSKKLSKKKVMKTSIVVICKDLGIHIGKFALPVRASLVLGATIILQRKSVYLLFDALDLKKKMDSSRRTGRPTAIDMREVPKNKAVAAVTLEVNPMTLALNLHDLEGFFDEENELTAEYFKRNTARAEQITIPGQMITDYSGRPKKEADPLKDDFGGIGMEDIIITVLPEEEQVHGPIDEQAFDATDDGLGRRDQTRQIEPAAVIPDSQRVDQREASPDVPILPGHRGRSMKLKFDKVTQISKEEFKVQIGNIRAGCKPHRDIEAVKKEAIRKAELSATWTTGDAKMAKSLQASRHNAYLSAVAAFREQAELVLEEDPFGWCGPAPVEPEPEEELVSQNLMAAPVADPLDPGFDVLHLDAAPTNDAGQEQTFQEESVPAINVSEFLSPQRHATQLSGVAQRGVAVKASQDNLGTQLPAPKKIRREATTRDRVERMSACGDYMEARYKKLVNQGEDPTFQRLMDGNSRKKVARSFFYLLGLVKHKKVRVEQPRAYGTIYVTKTDPDTTL